MRSGTVRVIALAFLVAAPAVALPAETPKGSRPRRAKAARGLPVLGEGPANQRFGPSGHGRADTPEGPRKHVGEPISLDLKDADLRDVLLTFSRLARLNMAIDPDVRGSVTVRLENVPWDQALEVILRINGLGYVVEGNIVRIGSPSKL